MASLSSVMLSFTKAVQPNLPGCGLLQIKLHARVGGLDDVAVLEFLAAGADSRAVQARCLVVVARQQDVTAVAGARDDAGALAGAPEVGYRRGEVDALAVVRAAQDEERAQTALSRLCRRRRLFDG